MVSNVTEIFGIDVFDKNVMQERLPKKVYDSLIKTIENGTELNPEIAEVVANAMKDWAIEKGATHYTHWFQPMTGITAEKHDSFINPIGDGKVIMEFSGKELIKGESDASSFPSGGLRATFEARGYTAWDCTSPAFLREDAAGVTLCIPTAFCSYTGEALDMKTPLLRSMEAISTQAVRICKLFGHKDVKRVLPSVGPEQEYFIVDKEKYLKRDDLIFTGRTLFGSLPPKGQELDDHYYGSIKERIASFMKDINIELWKLGVTAKTQHNEVAPAQHELAPIYATCNIACDHNQLVMETMKKVANRHGLTCLLHEKPFAKINGSGKHNNWSLVTDTGKNLLDPGKTPHENIQFLLFLTAVIKAVDEHADLLRVSAANPGNDLRQGAQEAPPTIISVYVGSQLEDVIAQLIETGEAKSSKTGGNLNMGVHTMPALNKDATDRNRTSPFAFTGNKFEFRSVGSSASIAMANTVLNTIVADSLCSMADELEKADDLELAIHDLMKKTLNEHQRILFNGDGYSDEWVKEAERRGLPNTRSMVEAIPALVSESSIQVFEKFHVFSEKELLSRKEIMYEAYSKAYNIEAKTMISMVSVKYLPAVLEYMKKIADTINSMKQIGAEIDVTSQVEMLKKIQELFNEAKVSLDQLKRVTQEAKQIADAKEQAQYFRAQVVPSMEALRKPIDELELIVDKNLWPVPTYGDLLFEV